MIRLNPQYIKDHKGKKTMVVMPLKDYESLIEELEELKDIKRYDEAKKSNESSIPIDEAFKMIEAKRQAK